jgi:hypothetical protein
MPLRNRTKSAGPKELALFWEMETPEGKTVDVYVYASTLQCFDQDPVGPVGLLKRHRTLLEKAASDKFDRDGAVVDRAVHILVKDIMPESNTPQDEVE